MPAILITGGTGLIGQQLSKMLREKGYEVRHLSRRANSEADFPTYKWDINKRYIDPEALKNLDGIIHLAGAGLTEKRWTAARKKVMIDSRVEGTKLLVAELEKLSTRPPTFVSASAIGYYGNTADKWLDEDCPPPAQKDFKSECCVLWEEATDGIEQMGIRLAIIRIGIVLSTHGGALAEMMAPMKFRLASYFGNGRAYYSWIHITDMCRMLIFALENDLRGVYNGVAPNPVPNKELMQALVKASGKWSLLAPVPSIVLRIGMGEMSAIVLDSNRVSAKKIEEAGFSFSFPEISQALVDLLKHKK